MTDESASADPALVARAQAGDAAAIDALLARHVPHLRRYLAKNAAGIVDGRESMSDLVQSVCREAVARLGDGRFEVRGDGEFRMWLYGAAMLKVRNRQRYWNAEARDRARLHSGSTTSDAGVANAAAGEPSPSDAAIEREESQRLARAFDRLEPEQQAIVLWSHVDGLTHEAIAERLGITPAHSRTKLSRALARLATLATSS